jgi:hypothetical protein
MIPARTTRCCPPIFVLAAVGVMLAGCAASETAYQSPYGPRPSNPLPNSPGGGIWYPGPFRPGVSGTASLIPRIPPAAFTQNTAPPSSSPNEITPATAQEQEARIGALRDGHVGAMDQRLVRERAR